MSELHYQTVTRMSRALAEREVSSVELTEEHLERIAALDPSIGAYLAVTPDTARAQAAEADRRIAQGDAGPLTGIPLQLKDNLSTRGIATTCASLMLEGYTPPYDATVTTRLAEAGGTLLGKGNMDEFAMGGTTDNSALLQGQTYPLGYLCTHVPGGSIRRLSCCHCCSHRHCSHTRSAQTLVDPSVSQLATAAVSSASSHLTDASHATASLPLHPRSTRSDQSRKTVDDAALMLNAICRLLPESLDSTIISM